jgi:hypothetical protein
VLLDINDGFLPCPSTSSGNVYSHHALVTMQFRLNKNIQPSICGGAPLQFRGCVLYYLHTTASVDRSAAAAAAAAAVAATVAAARRLLLALHSWLLCLWRPCCSVSASTATGVLLFARRAASHMQQRSLLRALVHVACCVDIYLCCGASSAA